MVGQKCLDNPRQVVEKLGVDVVCGPVVDDGRLMEGSLIQVGGLSDVRVQSAVSTGTGCQEKVDERGSSRKCPDSPTKCPWRKQSERARVPAVPLATRLQPSSPELLPGRR